MNWNVWNITAGHWALLENVASRRDCWKEINLWRDRHPQLKDEYEPRVRVLEDA